MAHLGGRRQLDDVVGLEVVVHEVVQVAHEQPGDVLVGHLLRVRGRLRVGVRVGVRGKGRG